jgi:hypothetical protein
MIFGLLMGYTRQSSADDDGGRTRKETATRMSSVAVEMGGMVMTVTVMNFSFLGIFVDITTFRISSNKPFPSNWS